MWMLPMAKIAWNSKIPYLPPLPLILHHWVCMLDDWIISRCSLGPIQLVLHLLLIYGYLTETYCNDISWIQNLKFFYKYLLWFLFQVANWEKTCFGLIRSLFSFSTDQIEKKLWEKKMKRIAIGENIWWIFYYNLHYNNMGCRVINWQN